MEQPNSTYQTGSTQPPKSPRREPPEASVPLPSALAVGSEVLSTHFPGGRHSTCRPPSPHWSEACQCLSALGTHSGPSGDDSGEF